MWHWGHGLWMLGWWMLVAAGIAWFVWVTAQASRSPDDGATAEELLRRLYAAGEIGEDDFRAGLAVLSEGRRRGSATRKMS